MVSKEQVAAGVGAGAVGITISEIGLHARERGNRILWLVPVGSAVAAIGLGGIGAATGRTGPRTTASLLGYGGGVLGWVAARERGLAPRLTVDVPDEVNLAAPLVTAFTLSVVGLALSPARDAARAVVEG